MFLKVVEDSNQIDCICYDHFDTSGFDKLIIFVDFFI